jgi:Alpha/beta hydrolase domain
MFAAIAALVLAVGATPVPKATGPIPVTANSYPFMTATKSTPPLDLSKVGYVEEEYIVSGTANVYDWSADGAVTVRTPNAPYTTRILVRRPRTGFSGSVIVEPLFTARRFDWSMMWGFSHDYVIDHKDAWVGITMPNSVDGLKKFNPTRYSDLSFANPSPNTPCTGAQNNTPAASEDGLKYDVISQVAALLKSDLLKAQYVFLTTQGADVATYANAIHANLQNGKPAYDGYLVKAPFTMGRINQCAPAIAANDPRQIIKNVGVPVIEVTAQGEVIGGTYTVRRDDSDAPNDRFRLYEVASAGHIDKFAYFGFPALADQTAAVGSAQGTVEWPFNAKCDPEIPLMEPSLIGYVFNASFAALDQWTRKGTPAPRATRIELKDAGTPQASVVTDKLGHGVGGVRTPFIDVPDATYFTNSPGPGTCREMGHKAPFDAAKITDLYSSRQNFAKRFSETVDRLVKERWLTEGDAKRLKQALNTNSN